MKHAGLPEKQQATKDAREAAVECFEADGLKARRPTAANATVELDEVFLCLNVQHSQTNTFDQLRFCINYGVLPKEMFAENWTGYLGTYPRVVDCVFSSRLKPRLDQSDWWWTLTDTGDLPQVVGEIWQAAVLVKTAMLPKLETAVGCLTHQNIANPNRPSLHLSMLDDWRVRYA